MNEPNSESYLNRFNIFSEDEISFDAEDHIFQVSEANGPSYEFDDPNFNIVEYRSNFVVRWEYIPGSVLFLVWANNGSISNQDQNNSFRDLSSQFNNLESTNTFLIKYTYRFVL